MSSHRPRNTVTWTLFIWVAIFPVIASAKAQDTKKHSSAHPMPAQLVQELTSLRDAALEDNYAYDRLTYLTENIGARSSGSLEAAKAVEYVADELRKLGLDVKLEEVQVPHWVRGIETGELVAFPGQFEGITHKVVLTALGNSASTGAGGITAEVVVVNNFDELTKLGRDRVAGKIVLYNVPFDKRKAAAGNSLEAYGEAVIYRGDGAKAAAQLGAIASLVRSVGGADYRLPHTGWSEAAGIPAGAVTAEDASLIAHLAKEGPVRMHLTLTPQRLADVTSYNVVGEWKGSEHPEQIVVVSGHLDSWDLATGAVDDAAGVAIAMETAHLMKKLQLTPKRTLRVIAWMDEENGGAGHAAYAKAHGADFANYVGAIESDLGAEHPLGFNAKISPGAFPFLEPVQEILRSFGANLMRPTNFSPGADVTEMSKAGVPSFGVMQEGLTYFNYHHSAADTLDKVDPHELQENAAAMAVLGYALTNMPDPLPR